MKETHEYRLISLLIARVGKAKNNNHQELLYHGLDNKNQQDMVAVAGDAAVCGSNRKIDSSR
jgi:hypothetical protein